MCVETTIDEEATTQPDKKAPLIDVYLNPNKSEALEFVTEKKKRQFQEYFKNSDMRELYPNLFKILWFAALPCSPLPGLTDQFMLKECEVANKKVDCSKIFRKVPTDSGMCCALNMENALRESEYTQLVRSMQTSTHFGKKDVHEKEVIKAAPGIQKGIRITLDLHSNFDSFGTVYGDFDAFRIFIGQADEFPNLRDMGLVVQPGHEHFLSISNEILKSDPDVRKIDPTSRNCYFSDEGNLEFYHLYTFSNCMLECGIKLAQQELNCIPWFLPQSQNSTICDPWTARNFSTIMSVIQADADKCSECLPDCESNDYLVTPTAVKFG